MSTLRSGLGISVRSFDHRAAVGHVVGRQHEVLAAVAELLVVPGELDDLHRLFEDLAVDAVVLGRHLVVAAGHDGAERPRLAGHRAAADAELHPPAGEDVGDGEVLGEAQRVPLRHDVEHLPEAQTLGEHRQVLAELDQVGQHLVALVLEVVLGEPHRVEAELVGRLGPVDEVLVALDDGVVAEAPRRRGDGRIAGVGHRERCRRSSSRRACTRIVLLSDAGGGAHHRPWIGSAGANPSASITIAWACPKPLSYGRPALDLVPTRREPVIQSSGAGPRS